jgi:two-component system phosphate regulon sensor histidine kinase PhoR
MNFSNPKTLVFSLSAFVLALYLLLVFAFFPAGNIALKLIVGAVVSILMYLVTYALFKKFILEKIKGIYKNIVSHKSQELLDIDIQNTWTDDPVNSAGSKVANWSEKQKTEIATLKKQEQFRREFLGNVAHELKTPLFNMQGYILTLLDGGLEDENINMDYLKRAATNADRMISIIEDLDEISRLDSGEIALHKGNFGIVELVSEVFHSLEIQAKKKAMDLKFDKEKPKEILVLADKDKIRQVLVNLISNALKYGIQGGWVKVQFTDMEDAVMVEIEDNGIGIEEKHLPRLFERFYRVDESRSRELGGSGLGLAIVKHIVEAHQQKIGVRSSVKSGSVFHFTLEKKRK